MIRTALTGLLALGLTVAGGALWAGQVTVCQCNIFDGGKWTDQDQSKVTYDTARRFAQYVASVNPTGSTYPPISVIGMEELMTETDRTTIQSLLQQHTGAPWASARVAQGVNGTSGIGFFWRTDLLESPAVWTLGDRALEQIDNGYVIRFAGRLFRKIGTDEAFGLFTGKLVWSDAILHGHTVTEEERRQEAVLLKGWIRQGAPGSPGMSGFPGTTRIITTDLNTDTQTATWQEMNAGFSDPSSAHTHNSFVGTTAMDIFGARLDYVWWDYDSYTKRDDGFADGPRRSTHFGSDHRAVYATVDVHPVDLTPPQIAISAPANGGRVEGSIQVKADASDESGILQVRFFVDGAPAWTDTAAPFEFQWDASLARPGAHTLTAEATDASSNRLQAVSKPLMVWTGAQGEQPTIGDLKLQTDGAAAVLPEKIVTAEFADGFYIQEPDRSSGIRVTNGTAAAPGMVVTVTGTLGTLNGERQVSALSVSTVHTGDAPLPLSMSTASIGGGAQGDHNPGVWQATGTNNTGLLVSCEGRVTGTVGSYYLYLDDGCRLRDGYGYDGVRIDTSALSGWTASGLGSYLRVTGISNTFIYGGKIQRRVKVRSTDDVEVLY